MAYQHAARAVLGDLEPPIVSVSLGVPAVFLFGGHRRAYHSRRVPLAHGDVVVWEARRG